MSGGAGGSILAMILSLKANKAILPKRKSYRELRELYDTAHKNRHLKYGKADPEYLKSIRTELIKERKKELAKRIIIIILSLLIGFVLVSIPLFWLNSENVSEMVLFPESTTETLNKEKIHAYKMFINFGDHHFLHHEYTLAVTNYEAALKIFDDDINIKYNFAIILYHSCLDSSLYCHKAIESFSTIINDTSTFALKMRSDIFMHLQDFEKAEKDLFTIEKLRMNN
jgi:tetratricopeptide (TPR) repeat protein